jgi:hypothetical protein
MKMPTRVNPEELKCGNGLIGLCDGLLNAEQPFGHLRVSS